MLRKKHLTSRSTQFLLALLLLCSLLAFIAMAASAQSPARTLRVQQTVAARGQNKTLIIEIEAMGNENAVGFSLNFDTKQLRFVSAVTINGAASAALNLNDIAAANGRVGMAFALPGGQKLGAGKQSILLVTFAVLAGDNVSTTTVSFGDQPIPREVVDFAANALPANFSGATLTFAQPMSTVSAASFSSATLAAESIVASFGSRLATKTQVATAAPLPDSLAGSNIVVKDSAGVERAAPLFFVSPTQVNFLAPAGTANGPATIVATSGDGTLSVATAEIATVAPALFSAGATGQGLAVAIVQRVRADGSSQFEPIARFDTTLNRYVAIPIDLGLPADQVFLVLFGTGFRFRSNLSSASVKIGGADAQVLFAGATPGLYGLDQINARLPRTLIGRGDVSIVLTVDGKSANAVTANIK